MMCPASHLGEVALGEEDIVPVAHGVSPGTAAKHCHPSREFQKDDTVSKCAPRVHERNTQKKGPC